MLVCTNYITKHTEVKFLEGAKTKNAFFFTHEEIFTRFCVPREPLNDKAQERLMKLKTFHESREEAHYQAQL